MLIYKIILIHLGEKVTYKDLYALEPTVREKGAEILPLKVAVVAFLPVLVIVFQNLIITI